VKIWPFKELLKYTHIYVQYSTLMMYVNKNAVEKIHNTSTVIVKQIVKLLGLLLSFSRS